MQLTDVFRLEKKNPRRKHEDLNEQVTLMMNTEGNINYIAYSKQK